MSDPTPVTEGSTAPEHDRDYIRLRDALVARLAAARGPLFTTDADMPDAGRSTPTESALFALYLDGLDPAVRQHYACSACRKFFRRFGGLVSIDEKGRSTPLLWSRDETGPSFAKSQAALYDRVEAARVVGVWLCDEPVWGRPETGDWTHFGGPVDESLVYSHQLMTPGQRMAELAQDFETLSRALETYTRPHVRVALKLLDSDQLYRSEKVLGVARWLDGLMESLPKVGKKKGAKGKKARQRAHLIWRAVATAPPGFAHVRSSMIGTLLDDIAAGKSYDEVAGAFRAKMHPLQYQRPQAAPKAGNIKQAQAIVDKLESAGALKRRLARLDDLKLLWRARDARPPTMSTIGAAVGQVFDHLLPGRRSAPALDGLPTKTLTWVKFRETVLPSAGRIEIEVPDKASFYAFVTAADPEAPPIVQWDTEADRNPVTWYTYMEPRPATSWGLKPGWRPVTGVCLFPHQWGADEDRHAHQGKGAMMVIEGCVAPEGGGSGLFPEFLRSEYRAVRATMEAFSKAATLEGRELASACGLTMRPNTSASLRLRVHAKADEIGGVMAYVIDRWD